MTACEDSTRRVAAYAALRVCVLLGAAIFAACTVGATVASAQCVGDCNGSGDVSVDELVTGVHVALGNLLMRVCPAFDANDDEMVSVDELVMGVDDALDHCPPVPTLTATPTPISAPTPTVSRSPQPADLCGDNQVNQSSEQCDGSDDALCPGRCAPDCKCCPEPVITSIDPLSGSVGAQIAISGSNLDCGGASSVHLTCGGRPLTIGTLEPTMIHSSIPPGAQDCSLTIVTPGGMFTLKEEFDVVLSKDFALTALPAENTVVQGSSTTYTISATGTGGFAELIALGIDGLPAGVTGSFAPATITAGQSAVLTVTATTDAPFTSLPKTFSIAGTAAVDGGPVMHSIAATSNVHGGGQTGIVGRFVFLHGPPLEGVKLRLNIPACSSTPETCPVTQTDAGGNFRFLGVPEGTHTMSVDVTPVDRRLPIYGVDVTLAGGEITELPLLKICPPLPPERYTPLQNQQQDQDIADPDNPGAVFTVPAGVTITGWDGKPKDKMTIMRLDPDELPVPPPPGPTRSVYQPFFGTPMGGLPSAPIPVTLPNDMDLVPGDKAELWSYDAAPFPGVPGQWRLNGAGTVSEDGSKIVSDPGVGITRFCGVCGLSCFIGRQAGQPNHNPDGSSGGDPVNLQIGQMIFDKTDLVLPGRIPAVVNRIYNPIDPFAVGRFQLGLGPGWTFSVDVVVQAETATLLRLILPGNSRFAFVKQANGTFVNTTSPRFAGAVLTIEGGSNYEVRFKDGTRWNFVTPPPLPGVGLLSEQIDRNGNRLLIERELSLSGGLGRIIRLIEPAGRELAFSYAGARPVQVSEPLGRTVHYTYNGSGRLETVTDPAGGMTRYTYDAVGGLLTITDPKGITFVRNEYSQAERRVTRQTEPDGGEWRFEDVQVNASCESKTSCSSDRVGTKIIDPRGNATTHMLAPDGFPRSVTNALGQTTTFERDASGKITAVTDPLGRVGRLEYDAAGNVTKVIDPAANAWNFEYEPTFSQLTKLIDPLSNVTTFEYDTAGNLTAITDPEQNLKPEGQRLKTVVTYDQLGQPMAVTDLLGNRTTFEYAAQGSLVAIVDPLGNTTRLSYDAVSRLIAQIDPRGKKTQLEYDELNQVTKIMDALGGVTRFAYDENGNLLSVTDALNHTTAYAYDEMDRPVRRTDPLEASETFEYDQLGNLIRHADRKGQVSMFTYDALTRRIRGEYADATTNFVYDAAERLAQATDTIGGDIVHAYDVLDRLAAETTGLGTVEYDYDALGRRIEMRVPGQDAVRYVYDANSRNTRITQGDQVVDLAYDALGRRTQLTLPNSVSTEYRYDDGSRLVELIYRNATGVLGNLTYDYDPAGNRTHVGGSWSRSLLPNPVASATYDEANRQQQFGAWGISYDENGNVERIAEGDRVTDLVWDSRGRMVAATDGTVAAQFAYDAAGRRIRKNINRAETRYGFDGADVSAELTGSDAIASLRTLFVDELLVRDHAAHYLTDALGSTVAVAGAAGGVIDESTYEPFGTVAQASGAANPFGFTGRESDETGLYYYRARYYSPTLHRFLSEDPLEFGGGDLNLYAYVGGRPTRLTDPDGQCLLVGASIGVIVGTTFETGGQVLRNALSGRKSLFAGTKSAFVRGAAGGAIAGLTCGAAGTYYLYRVRTLNVATAENAAVFYSNQANRALAEQFLRLNPGKNILETTPGGLWLEGQNLFGPNSLLTNDKALQLWARLSQRYAEGASGNVVGFVQGARPDRIFNTIEYPALLNNPRVVNVITGGY